MPGVQATLADQTSVLEQARSVDAQTIKTLNSLAQVPCTAQVLEIKERLHQITGLLQDEWTPQKICENTEGGYKDLSDGTIEAGPF